MFNLNDLVRSVWVSSYTSSDTELWASKACNVSHTAVFLLLPATRDITVGKPLPLEVTGIEYMNDDPAAVDVLYAKVSLTDKSDK